MNMVALSNRLASKVPHWHELEKLSKEDKIEEPVIYVNHHVRACR